MAGPLDQHLQGEVMMQIAPLHAEYKPNLSFLSPLDLLDAPCSNEHMFTIATNCTFDWRVVGRRLLFDRPQTVADIDREDKSEEVKRDKMFEKWKEMKGSRATYRALMEVFEDAGNHQGAEMVKELVSPIAEGDMVMLFGYGDP